MLISQHFECHADLALKGWCCDRAATMLWRHCFTRPVRPITTTWRGAGRWTRCAFERRL